MSSSTESSSFDGEENEFSCTTSQNSLSTETSIISHGKWSINATLSHSPLAVELSGLYAEKATAKIWKVASESIKDGRAPASYPEFAPEDGPTPGRYNTRDVKYWTAGFLPGSLYCLLERCIKFPMYLQAPGKLNRLAFHAELLQMCQAWAAPLHQMSYRTNTHDMGFILQPALRQDWELTGNYESFQSLVRGAENLASRYVDDMKAIRSWDVCASKRYSFNDNAENFLVIIDSMCNLDLLFYVGNHTGNGSLVDIATHHAHFVRRNLIREDYSTWHVVNTDPLDGSLKSKFTHQGYADDSTWARGQSWAILGFTQTYVWTKEPQFLETAVQVADHFIDRLCRTRDKYAHAHPFVPPWDFDAPVAQNGDILRDSSAGMIAANGFVLLHQILGSDSPYLKVALEIAQDTIALSQSRDPATLQTDQNTSKIITEGVTFDCILRHATGNYNEFAPMQYGNHGLVYADYFFLEFGNKLLRLGLV